METTPDDNLLSLVLSYFSDIFWLEVGLGAICSSSTYPPLMKNWNTVTVQSSVKLREIRAEKDFGLYSA